MNGSQGGRPAMLQGDRIGQERCSPSMEAGRPGAYSGLALSLALIALLSACVPLSGDERPTLLPPESSAAAPDERATPQATPSLSPLTEATPRIVIEPAEPTLTPTISPPAVNMPLEQMSLFFPGPASQVISPIQVAGYGGPSQKDRVQMRLIGEDGRLIAQGYAYLLVLPGNAGRFYGKVPFETEMLSERAWLQIRSFGKRFGMLKHMTTVELVLLDQGGERIHPAIRGPEKLAIFAPREESIVEGGVVTVRGAGWVDEDVPLSVEILDRGGNRLGDAQVSLDAPAVGQLGTFSIEVEYETPYPQWARIAVAEVHGDPPGVYHYSSVQVWLRP